jgi:hypothetical protein
MINYDPKVRLRSCTGSPNIGQEGDHQSSRSWGRRNEPFEGMDAKRFMYPTLARPENLAILGGETLKIELELEAQVRAVKK